jgi:hypothetical protein
MNATVVSSPSELEQTPSQRWMDRLASEGYRPRLETNEANPGLRRLAFKLEGTLHRLYIDDGDPAFFKLALSYLLGDDANTSSLALLQAANEVNTSTKGTKVTVDFEEGEAFFVIEWFGEELPTTETFARMLSHCSFAAKRFFTRLRESPRPALLMS